MALTEDDLRRRVAQGEEARNALRVLAPYLDRVRRGIFEAWTAEPDPGKRNDAWLLVRAIDILRTTVQQDAATGEQAAAELAYLAQVEKTS